MAEENINEIFEIEETERPDVEPVKSCSFAAENTLNVIAGIILWVGILCTIVCLFTITTRKAMYGTSIYDMECHRVFNLGGLVVSIGVFLSTLTSWALLKVMANISRSLKEINSKIM